jgi:hypothetical protein
LFEVLKRNKRMWIVRSHDLSNVYTPPDFVRVPNRAALQVLVTAMECEVSVTMKYPIASVMAFESRFSPKAP